MNSPKIDFSVLDIKRNPNRWESMVRGVLEKAETSRRRVTIFEQLVTWAKPALALAAAVALICFLSAVATHREQDEPASSTQNAALALSSWASGETMPETAAILTVLGERNVNQ